MVWEDMSFEEFQDGRQASWISEHEDFNNYESLYHCDTSHQVLAQSNYGLGGEFQDGSQGYRNGTILAILNLYVAPMPHIKFRLNLTYGFGGDNI